MRRSSVIRARRIAPAILGAAAISLTSFGGSAQAASKPICINLSPLLKAQIVLFGPLSSCGPSAQRTSRH